MGIGFRVFVVDDDDSIHRLSTARFHRLIDLDPKESIPRYAGMKKRFALAILEVSGRKLFYLKHIDYFIVHFDSKGRMDEKERQREIVLAVRSVPPIFEDEQSDSSIINAEQHFYKKEYDREFKWVPTPEMEKAILDSIFNPKGVPAIR